MNQNLQHSVQILTYDGFLDIPENIDKHKSNMYESANFNEINGT